MSGGAFDYIQYKFIDIIDPIENAIHKNGKEKTKEELEDDWYPSDNKFHPKYSDETIEAFKMAIYYVKMARAYTHRIDYLFSGDDGEEHFHKKLKEDIENINK